MNRRRQSAVGVTWLWGRMFASCGWFSVAVFASYFLVRLAVPPVTSVELHNAGGTRLWERVSEDAQIVLLGSSRMFFGVSDEELARRLGVPVANASLTAMRLQEMNEVLDFYLDRTPSAKVYLIELLSPQPEPYIATTSRQTAWYSLRSTRMLIDATWSESVFSLEEKLKHTSRHLRLFALRSRFFGSMIPDPEPVSRTPRRDDEKWRDKHQEALDEVVRGRHGRKYERSEAVQEFYGQIIKRIRERDVEPVFVVLPQVYENDFDVLSILKSYVSPYPVLDLGTPSLNPEFYDEEMWMDPYHIGGDGALQLSRKLAGEVQKLNLMESDE